MKGTKLNRIMITAAAALVLLLTALSGCGKTETAAVPTEPALSNAPAAHDEPAELSETEAAAGRIDGERFDETIVIEGMEEIVGYEHVRNEEAGYEMDFEYDALDRVSGTYGDRFISHYEDPDDPWNYLEVTYRAVDINTVISETNASLLELYDNVVPGSYTLVHAGSCTQLSASSAREGNRVSGSLQTAYIIPAGKGCIVAVAHCTMESAGGFGVRFSNMLNTLTLIER